VLSKILEDGESRHRRNLLFSHQAHRFITELGRVVDGGDAGLSGIEGAGFTHGVDRDACTHTVGFLHGGGELRLSVLVGSVQLAVDHPVRPGFVDFGEVGALFVLCSHHLDNLAGGVGVVGIREDMLSGIEMKCVFVAAENVDGVAAHTKTRTGNKPLVDGVAHRAVGRARTLRSHVSLGGKSGQQISFGGLLCQDGAPRY
jgi:hypothetical protein